MKVLGGHLKGRNFYMPGSIRPTQNILRQAIFDFIGHDLKGMSFLELYAGSGAVSLEAVSRGATEVVMVEHNDLNAQTIRENYDLLGVELGGPYKLIHADALACIKRFSEEGKRFDVVFFDPPFGRELAKKTLKLLGTRDILHPQSLAIVQFDKTETLSIPQGFSLLKERRYGTSYLMILQCVKEISESVEGKIK